MRRRQLYRLWKQELRPGFETCQLMLMLAALTLPCSAQTSTLRVFSEFTRIDPFGAVIPEDRGAAEPRHILSPGLPRNAFSSLRIVVTLDKPGKYILDVGQNPENAVKPTLYRERFQKHGDHWIPDGLEQVKIPYEAVHAEGDIPGQNTITFWLDMWVDAKAEVDRIKVEPQLWTSYADDWFTYPMEARILSTVVPAVTMAPAVLPDAGERSDAAARGPLRAAFCAEKEKPAGAVVVNARSLIRRNVLQQAAVKNAGAAKRLLQLSGAPTIQAWCSSRTPNKSGPEWYLKFRDFVFQAAGGEQ